MRRCGVVLVKLDLARNALLDHEHLAAQPKHLRPARRASVDLYDPLLLHRDILSTSAVQRRDTPSRAGREAGAAMKRCLSLLVLVAAIVVIPGAGAQELTRTAFDDLKQGGFVVVFRHGKTEEGREDKSPLDLTDCAEQAMLTEASRAQARAIGAAFVAASIPVGKVLASGYCRALEMGRLAFGRVETSDALLLRTYVPIPGAPVPLPWSQRVAQLRSWLGVPPDWWFKPPSTAPINTI